MKKWMIFQPLTILGMVSATVCPIVSCAKDLPKPTSIQISYNGGQTEDVKIDIDEELNFECSILPETITQECVWVSSNVGVADFIDGTAILKGKTRGETIVSAYPKGFPGMRADGIKVTVSHAQTQMEVDYSNVDFDSKITVGTSESIYRYENFDADFIANNTHLVGSHSLRAYAEWVDTEEPPLPTIFANVEDLNYVGNHTLFDIELYCIYTQWEIGKKYKYKLYFVIDEGTEDEKTIIVDRDLYFENTDPIAPQINEPDVNIVTPFNYGYEAIIQNVTSNFQIGAEHGNSLNINNINGISTTSANVENVVATATGSNFDIHFYFRSGLNLTNDIHFTFNYFLNNIMLQSSKEYIINAGKSIQTNDVSIDLAIESTEKPSLVVDDFNANFEFDNTQESTLPIISAFCKPVDQSLQTPSVSIINIDKQVGITYFSLKIDFSEKFVHDLNRTPFLIYFKINGEELCSENKLFSLTTQLPIALIGSKETMIFPETIIVETEEVNFYCVNIGVFTCPTSMTPDEYDYSCEFEWISESNLPNPDDFFFTSWQPEFSDQSPFYISLIWNNEFEFSGNPTYKIKIKNEDDEVVCVVEDLVLNKCNENQFWDINFESNDSNVTCNVIQNTRDNITIEFSSIDIHKELWGIDFTTGNCKLEQTNGITLSANQKQINVDTTTCSFIHGLELNIKSTYINPNSVINMDKTYKKEMEPGSYINTFYTSNATDLKANKTYYIKADLSHAQWPQPPEGYLQSFFAVGDPEQYPDIVSGYDLMVYTSCIVASCGEAYGIYGFRVDGATAADVVTKVLTFTLTPRKDLGKHKLFIALPEEKY